MKNPQAAISYEQLHLFRPSTAALEDAGYGMVAHVPSIFDSNWVYQRDFSSYLHERSRGLVDSSFIWAAAEALEGMGHHEHSSRLRGSARAGRILTEQSIVTTARKLINFLEWCSWIGRYRKSKYRQSYKQEEEGSYWKCVTYNDLVCLYADQMSKGMWGTKRLAASTVNGRVDEACYFLHWAATKGLREPFFMDVCLRAEQRGGARSKGEAREVAGRVGRVREDPALLIMPLEKDVEQWQKCVALEFGYVKGLMCRLIEDCAVRREECALWRVWTLPEEKSEWQISLSGAYVTVCICYGAKGEKSINDRGDIVGPKRYIRMSIAMAEELHHYRDVMRPRLLRNYVMAGKTAREKQLRRELASPRLFLSEYDGTPISGRSLYKAWTQASYQPVVRWHPHLMRHYWTVTTLWKERIKAAKALELEHENIVFTGDWISGEGRSDLLLIVQPQLGHISERNVNAYLVWLRQKFDASSKHDDWLRNLGEEMIYAA
ncbi:hypothetical protein [Herbaspirillum sp. 1130]|uniref:hypothetical protein n=1 Tax=Herbaspirillum sp. 1130 TaxID=2806562 RepID=UPI001AE9F1D7|nr:hypothetical protein [Herbaspirillum sp. 1130]MBP1317111.1 hypothetical protein [Herbaspirillum sp. 1130]